MANTEPPRIAILASGSGTTAECVIRATQTGVLKAVVALVVSNNRSAGVWKRVGRLNEQYGLQIALAHISGLTHPDGPGEKGEQTLGESAAIADLCQESGVSLVALLGYMKKVRGPLLGKLLVNTHPGSLPETAGLYGTLAQERVLDLGLSHSAVTLHYVADGYDEGEIIAVHPVPVMPGDTPDKLFDAVQATEKAHLPVDLNNLLHGAGD